MDDQSPMDLFGNIPNGKISVPQKGSFIYLQTILSYCGRERLEKGAAYSHASGNSRYGPHAILQYTLRGEGRLEHRRKIRRLRPGDLMVLTSDASYRYYLPEDSPGWEFCFVTPAGGEAIRFAKTIIENRGTAFRLDDLSVVAELRAILQSVLTDGNGNIFDLSIKTYAFMARLLEFSVKDSAPQIKDALIGRIKSYCKKHFANGIGVNDVARALERDRSHISRYFRRMSGLTLIGYINALRLKEAANLLSHNLPVKETSYLCGFRNVSYFCKLFKSEYGLSPREYSRKYAG